MIIIMILENLMKKRLYIKQDHRDNKIEFKENLILPIDLESHVLGIKIFIYRFPYMNANKFIMKS